MIYLLPIGGINPTTEMLVHIARPCPNCTLLHPAIRHCLDIRLACDLCWGEIPPFAAHQLLRPNGVFYTLCPLCFKLWA